MKTPVPEAKLLDAYFDEARIFSLLHEATTVLCKLRPTDPEGYLSSYFARHSASMSGTHPLVSSPLAWEEEKRRMALESAYRAGVETFTACFAATAPAGVGKGEKPLDYHDIVEATPLNSSLRPGQGTAHSPPVRNSSSSLLEDEIWLGRKGSAPSAGSTMLFSPVLGHLGDLMTTGSPPPFMSPMSRSPSPLPSGSRSPFDHPELLTDDEVQNFHAMLRTLQKVTTVRDAVKMGNLCWDHSLNRCVPGRVWRDKLPDVLRKKLDVDFTPAEKENVRRICKLDSARTVPPGMKPRVLYILGPAGAGKSTIRDQAETLLNITLNDYVELEGDVIRKEHSPWMEILEDQRGFGFKDSMHVISKHVDRIKDDILKEAVRNRKNLLIAKTGQDCEKFKREVTMMRHQFGYVIDCIGLVVSMKEAGYRAMNRAHENGRWHVPSHTKWLNVMNSIKYLMDPNCTDNCVVFDNQNFSRTPIYTRTHNMSYVCGIISNYDEQDRGEPDLVVQ